MGTPFHMACGIAPKAARCITWQWLLQPSHPPEHVRVRKSLCHDTHPYRSLQWFLRNFLSASPSLEHGHLSTDRRFGEPASMVHCHACVPNLSHGTSLSCSCPAMGRRCASASWSCDVSHIKTRAELRADIPISSEGFVWQKTPIPSGDDVRLHA
jgi:hypothetical protein